MMFLNQLLIWGGLAASIPLVIHLLNRSRYRTIDWGAMHLLESVIKVNYKRFRVEQLILLLIRCSIPALLALCLARPVLKGSGLLEGDTPVSLVVVLDNSYSMDTVEAAGTRFEQAVTAAKELVGATQRGSEVSVILTGGQATPLFDQPVFDADAVVRKLAQLRGGMGASDVPAALDLAVSTLEGMRHAHRELIVVSDFQPRDWETFNANGAGFRERLRGAAVPPTLTLLPIGQDATGNLAVESLQFSRRALGVGQTLNVRANLRNFGAVATGTTRVVLKIDGVETDVTQVSLPANSGTQLLFPCQFEASGSHVFEVELVADDPLPTDNRLAAAVNVWDRLPVLLVDGDPNPQPLMGETDYLSVALTPFTFGRLQLTDLLETRTIAGPELSAENLQGTRVVVLANVSRLDDSQLAALSEFVSRGGALLVFVGNRIDLNWYNQSMYANGAGLLPAAIGRLHGASDDQDVAVAIEDVPQLEAAKVVVQPFEHPALTLFNDPAQGDLSTATFRKWYQLQPNQDESQATSVMAWLDSGEPLLAERQFDQGIVIQMATACDADWSDLPTKPIYVPLMQQLVATVAASLAPPQNIGTGEPAVALLDESDSDEGAIESDTATLVLPDGSQRTLKVGRQDQRKMIRFDETQRPGVYTLTTPRGDTLQFVATTSREESEPALLQREQLEELASRVDSQTVASADQYIEQDQLRRHGREIWKYVLGGLLILMFLEVILQQKFARVAV